MKTNYLYDDSTIIIIYVETFFGAKYLKIVNYVKTIVYLILSEGSHLYENIYIYNHQLCENIYRHKKRSYHHNSDNSFFSTSILRKELC